MFVRVVKGKHKGQEGYIVGKTSTFYWVKMCGLVCPGIEDRACFAKHNVLQVGWVKNKMWERWAQEDPTSMLAELLVDLPNPLVEAQTKAAHARPYSARRDSIIDELSPDLEHLALELCSVQIHLTALHDN